MYSKINRLFRAAEAAHRIAVKSGLPLSSLQAFLVERIQTIEPILERFVKDAASLKASGRYSPKGLVEQVELLRAEATGKVNNAVSQSNLLQARLEQFQKEIAGSVKRTRDKNRRADERSEIMAELQAQEIRRHLLEMRKTALAEYESGPKREAFQDPVKAIFLEACRTYGPDRETLLQAVQGAPWPLSFLDGETLQEGEELLQKAIAPEMIEASNLIQTEAAMEAELFQAVADILQDPLAQVIGNQQHAPMPDPAPIPA